MTLTLIFEVLQEKRLGLLTIVTLFPVITLLSLGTQRILALVLCRFVGLELATFLEEHPAGLRNAHCIDKHNISTERPKYLNFTHWTFMQGSSQYVAQPSPNYPILLNNLKEIERQGTCWELNAGLRMVRKGMRHLHCIPMVETKHFMMHSAWRAFKS